MNDLIHKKCIPCEGGMPPLTREESEKYLVQTPGWELEGWELEEGGKSISRKFKFKDFKEAMVFVNKVADLAEAEGHHPDIHISWNGVKLELSTHAIKGLSENDFILAAKINALLQ